MTQRREEGFVVYTDTEAGNPYGIAALDSSTHSCQVCVSRTRHWHVGISMLLLKTVRKERKGIYIRSCDPYMHVQGLQPPSCSHLRSQLDVQP